MAKAELIGELPKPPPAPSKVVLEMSVEEALAVYRVLRKIGGTDSVPSAKKAYMAATSVHDVLAPILRDLMAPYYCRIPFIDDGLAGEIKFLR